MHTEVQKCTYVYVNKMCVCEFKQEVKMKFKVVKLPNNHVDFVLLQISAFWKHQQKKRKWAARSSVIGGVKITVISVTILVNSRWRTAVDIAIRIKINTEILEIDFSRFQQQQRKSAKGTITTLIESKTTRKFLAAIVFLNILLVLNIRMYRSTCVCSFSLRNKRKSTLLWKYFHKCFRLSWNVSVIMNSKVLSILRWNLWETVKWRDFHPSSNWQPASDESAGKSTIWATKAVDSFTLPFLAKRVGFEKSHSRQAKCLQTIVASRPPCAAACCQSSFPWLGALQSINNSDLSWGQPPEMGFLATLRVRVEKWIWARWQRFLFYVLHFLSNWCVLSVY